MYQACIKLGVPNRARARPVALLSRWVGERQASRVETTFETEGSLRDVHYTTLGTIQSVIRPDGTLHGDVKGGLRADGNDTGVYRGITGGTYTEATAHGRTYRGAITFENAVGAFAGLNSVLAVFELNIDDAGKLSFRTLGAGASIPDPRIEPGRTAIVAVDFQNDIVGAHGAFASLFRAEVQRTSLIPIAAGLLDGTHAAGVTVVYSRARPPTRLPRTGGQHPAVHQHRPVRVPHRRQP